jgi:hypothetical protein
MADENLLDLQAIQVQIPQGANGTRITVTHNLQDTDGNPLTPDMVNVEVIAYPDVAPNNPCTISAQHVFRSSPEDGTYDLEIRASEQNIGPAPWDIILKINSEWHHSVQSDDHIPELTVQPGTPIDDCTPVIP